MVDVPEQERDFGFFMELLKRRRRVLAIATLSVLALSTLIAFAWPPVYRSSATILIEDQDIPRDFVRSTITSFAAKQVQVISQRVMTTNNISNIIDRFELYPNKIKRWTLAELVEEFRGNVDLHILRADVIDPLSGRPTQATIAFTLAFDYPNASIAQRVASELVDLYLNENLRDREQKADEALGFLKEEASRINREMLELEQQLADFKERNEGALPDLYQMNVRLIDRTESEISAIDNRMQQLADQSIYLRSELAQLSPNAPVRLPSGEALLDESDRLRAAKTQRASLAAIYGPDHPDIRRLAREIELLEGDSGGSSASSGIEEQLQAHRLELSAARDRYTEDHPDVRRLERTVSNLEAQLANAGGVVRSIQGAVNVREGPTEATSIIGSIGPSDEVEFIGATANWYQVRLSNGSEGFVSQSWTRLVAASAPRQVAPVVASDSGVATNPAYVELSAQLNSADTQIAALKSTRAELVAKRAEYEDRIMRTPQVEQEFLALMRDYQNAAVKYQELKAKQLEAEVGKSMEQDQKGERFSLIEPPLAAEEPYKPNRWAILLIGLIVSLVGGAGTAAVAENLDHGVRGMGMLAALTGTPPLAVIPYIKDEQDSRREAIRKAIMLLSVLAVIGLILLIIHFFYKPLDVLWYVIMRRLGIWLG